MVSVLFGLSMDYQVFLVSRMYEEWLETGDNRRAVRVGLAETSRVINSAAVIMISVFLAFVLSGDRVIAMFGIALAAAVALDAFVLRTLLVPALMHLLGGANWWLPALARPAAAAHQHRAARVPRAACEDFRGAQQRGRRRRQRVLEISAVLDDPATSDRHRRQRRSRMFAISLGDDGAELRPLEPWHAEEFLAHIERGREFIGRYDPLRRPSPPTSNRRGPCSSGTPTSGRRHGPAVRHLAGRHPRRRACSSGSSTPSPGNCEVGCWLEPAAAGRGLVTRAVRILIDWAVEERGMHRVEWVAVLRQRTERRVARAARA